MNCLEAERNLFSSECERFLVCATDPTKQNSTKLFSPSKMFLSESRYLSKHKTNDKTKSF